MCTPLWRGTMAVYRFLASGLYFFTFLHFVVFMLSLERFVDDVLLIFFWPVDHVPDVWFADVMTSFSGIIFSGMAISPTGGVLSYLPHHLDFASEDSVGHSTYMSVVARRRAIMGSIVQPKRSCLGAATGTGESPHRWGKAILTPPPRTH